jgi:hypothetical protein
MFFHYPKPSHATLRESWSELFPIGRLWFQRPSYFRLAHHNVSLMYFDLPFSSLNNYNIQ